MKFKSNIVFGRDIVNLLTRNMPSDSDIATFGDILAQH